MLSQIVFVAFFLAVCIRNSVEVPEKKVIAYECWNDNVATNTIQKFSNGIIPILLYENENPMITNNVIRNFMIKNYNYLIIVNNSNNQCRNTAFVLQRRQTSYRIPAVFMMKEAQMVSNKSLPKIVATFVSDFHLNKIKESAKNYSQRSRMSKAEYSLFGDIRSKMDHEGQAIDHQGIQLGNPVEYSENYPEGRPVGHPMGNPEGLQMGNPVIILPRPNDPRPELQHSSTSNRSIDQSQESGQMVQQYYQTGQMVQPPWPNYQTGQVVQPSWPYYQAGHMMQQPYYQASQPTPSIPPTSQIPIKPTPIKPTPIKPTPTYPTPTYPTPTSPTLTYPMRLEIPETRNLLDSLDKQKGREVDLGGSYQTPSESYNWKNYSNKKSKFGGMSSRSSNSP